MTIICHVESCQFNDSDPGECNTFPEITLEEDDYHFLFSCDCYEGREGDEDQGRVRDVTSYGQIRR